MVCPVSAPLAYLAIRRNGPGFHFLFSDGHLLTKQRFVSSVREALAVLGMNPSRYTGHIPQWGSYHGRVIWFE